jgi:hypothetical protein
MTTVVKLMPRRCLLQGTYAFHISFVHPLSFFFLIPWTGDEKGKGGGNINKVQELAAERTKYCSRVALETPFLRKQASGAPILVSSTKEKVRGNCCSMSL